MQHIQKPCNLNILHAPYSKLEACTKAKNNQTSKHLFTTLLRQTQYAIELCKISGVVHNKTLLGIYIGPYIESCERLRVKLRPQPCLYKCLQQEYLEVFCMILSSFYL